jgi:Regulator of chromosome condensation (RCC1) repeat/Tyrosine-protein kinase ephrin type A/B receptor-like
MRSIFASGDSSFAIAAGDADVASGQLYAWGTAAHGFGIPPVTDEGAAASGVRSVVPVPRPVRTLAGVVVTTMAASFRHVVVSSASQGVTYAWGDNTYGQLGTGNSSAQGYGRSAGSPPLWMPRRVSALDNVVIAGLAAGRSHTLAVTDDGEVLAWGDNSMGQLGIGAPPAGFNASTSVALLTRLGWDIVPIGPAAAGNSTEQAEGLLANSSTSTSSSTDVGPVAATARRALLHSTTDVLTSVQPASALVAAMRGVDVYALGMATSQMSPMAADTSFVPVPALVLGIQQVTAVLAAERTSYAVRAVCFPGSVLDTGSGVCTTCAAGTVSGELSALSCTPCAPGTFSALAGGTTCSLCPAGSFGNGTGASGCTKCLAGLYLPFPGGRSRDQCVPCQPGTFSSVAGSATCTKCAPGTYLADVGGTQCLQCAPGTYQPHSGATSQQQCLKCPRCVRLHGRALHSLRPSQTLSLPSRRSGTFVPSLASSQFFYCAPGSYAAAPGSTLCSPCPAGSYSQGKGAYACTQCPPGTSLNATSGSNPSNCTACPPGSVALTPGTAQCAPCAPGSYYDGTSGNGTLCTLCPSGTYGSVTGGNSSSQACTPCPVGTHALSPGASTYASGATPCTMCPPGTYSDTVGLVQCTPCPAGTASSTIGAANAGTCVDCPPGTFCPFSGMAKGLPCPAGTYRPAGTDVTTCVQCPTGRYSTAIGCAPPPPPPF